MDILVPDSWLREFLQTKAAPEKIGEYLSLCGPSVERIKKTPYGIVYSVEVTTNRVDSAGIDGIAREASAILPRFGVAAKLLPIKLQSKSSFRKKVNYIDVYVDFSLCSRFSAALIRNVQVKDSPSWMKDRLAAVGLRPINNLVDITNYVMHELAQPMHVFDYKKIKGARMVLRKSKKGESITTLDERTYRLPGGDIVIEDGSGRLIDLAGIMGGLNSAVDSATRDVLLFVQTYNPVRIRHTSMSIAARSEASSLFEKGLDPEKVEIAIRRGIDLIVQLAGGQPEEKILDLYPRPYKKKEISTKLQFIRERMGIDIGKRDITRALASLGFKPSWDDEVLKIIVPSWRANDIKIPEDIVEECARIYGYFNLPSKLPTGQIPDPLEDRPFEFEEKIKNLLRGWGGIEVYTYSMVSSKEIAFGKKKKALRIKNPLGLDSEFMRLSLEPSLAQAVKANKNEQHPFHLFEVSNIYIPRKGDLPKEKMMLAGIFAHYDYASAKGVVENLLEELGIKYIMEKEKIKAKNIHIGQFRLLRDGSIYYEFEIDLLRKLHIPVATYKPIPKYPPHVEDISLTIQPRTLLGNVIDSIYKTDKRIVSVELIDVYKNIRTVRIFYQDPKKTLNDQTVEEIREKIQKNLKSLGIYVESFKKSEK